MKAIVTGAAGFIGSHVAERLAAQGCETLGIDDLSGSFAENVPPGVRLEVRNCTQPLDDLFADFRPDVVYHLAAYAAEGLSHHIAAFNYSNNVVATANVLRASYLAEARHFVFTSSIAAYGHPHAPGGFDETSELAPCDPYGIAKLACELHIRSHHAYFGRPKYTIFRPHNVFGPRQNISDPYRNVVGIFMKCALQGQPMPVFGDGQQSRSFSYIDSVAQCIAAAPFVAAANNEEFNVGSDESMTVLELAEAIAAIMKVSPNIQYLPSRQEVMHAHCRHDKVRRVFPEAFANAVKIREGLELMAASLDGQSIPPVTECPAPIEIADRLPPSWAKRLAR